MATAATTGATTNAVPSAGSDTALWITRALQAAIGHDRFGRYFAPGSAQLEVVNHSVVVKTPNEFFGRWLQSWIEPILVSVLQEHSKATAQPMLAVRWQVDASLSALPAAPAQQVPGTAQSGAGAAHRVGTSRWSPAAAPEFSSPFSSAGYPAAGPAIGPTTGTAAGTTGSGMTSGGSGGGLAGRWRRPDAARYRLEDFVVGDSNKLGYTAACSIASPDASPGFRALVLHGSCGLGKTHLLSGVRRRVLEQHPNARVRYVTAEQFANEFIASVGNSDLARFRQRYRGLDLLCIDDVHFLAGKQKTMAELEHTFESLDLAGARIVIASDAHPSQIADFSRRLTARLAGAVAVQLHKPDRATRLKIVEKLALERGLMIDTSTVQTIADACVDSVREIQGALAKLEALATHARLEGMSNGHGLISAALARRAVAEDVSGRVTKPIRVDTIAEVVCRALHVDMSEVLGNGRHKRVVLARSISAWLARKLTAHSFPEIAKSLHRPSHSTIVTQCQKVQRQIDADEPVDAGLEFDGVRLADFCERLRNEVLRRPVE